MTDEEFERLLNVPVPGATNNSARPPAGPSDPEPRRGVHPADFERLLNVPVPGATDHATAPEQAAGGASFGGAWQSVGVGMAKAAFETSDFLLGEPQETAKTELRRSIEAKGEKLAGESWVNAAIIPITQFVTGMFGAGGIRRAAVAAKPALRAVTRKAKVGAEVATAATVGAVVFDPHDERLSNVIESFPSLANPVTEYLAADPNDTAAEGRFKAMLESVGMDAATLGTFKVAVKAYRAARNGRSKELASATREFQVASSESVAPPQQDNAPLRDWLRIADVVDELEASPNLARVSSPAGAANAQGLSPSPRPPRPRELPFADVLPVLRQSIKDADAIDFHGSRRAAIEAGHAFGGGDLIPWQKFDTPDDVAAFIGRVAEARRTDFRKAKGGDARGVLTDAEVNRLIAQRVRVWGEDPDQVRGLLLEAGKDARDLAVHAEVSHVLGTKAMDEAHQVLQKMRWGNLAEFGGDPSAAMAEFVKRAGLAAELVATSSGIFSNAGRTLRRARGDVGTFSYAEIRKIQDLKPEVLAKLFEQSGGDIQALRFLLRRPGMLRRIVDGANFLLVNNLLWGATTHAVNLTTTATMIATRPAARAWGSVVQAGLRKVNPKWVPKETPAPGAATTEALRQYRYMAASLVDGVRQAGRAFVEGDSILSPFQVEHYKHIAPGAQRGQRIEFKPVNSVADLISNAMLHNAKTVGLVAIGLPTRTLGVVDEFTRQITYRSMVAARAAGEADRLGLQGQAYRDHVRKAIDNAFDVNGAGTDARALQEAKVVNFQQELLRGTAGHSLQANVSAHPIMRQVLPYVRTPVNVLRTSVKMTPGLNLLQREYRDMISGALGAEQQANAIGQMSLGSLLIGAAAVMAADGRITGSGPSNPQARQNLMAAGWKPNSYLRQNDDGTVTAIQIGRFDPVGMVFGMVADIADIMQHPDKEREVESALAAAYLVVLSQVRERTYVRNFIELLDAMSDPGSRGERFIGRMAANLVPGSSAMRNYGGASMEYAREATTLIDNIRATVPGLADVVPLKYDAFGDPITVRRGPWSTISNNIVDQEMVRMGLESNFTFPGPVPHHDGADLRKITMVDGRNAYEVYQQLAGRPSPRGPSLKETLARIIASPAYQRAPDGPSSERGTKQYMLAGQAAKYRANAKRMLLADKNVKEALSESSRKVAAAYQAQKVNADGRVERQALDKRQSSLLDTILESFGLGGSPQVPPRSR